VTASPVPVAGPDRTAGRLCPLSLTVNPVAAMLNFELADHPVYDGGELQWFDDDVNGTGMLAFLSRRDDRRVDYYAQRGLHLDRAGYHVGAGTGCWREISFDVARLEVAGDGVEAEVGFPDVDGRLIEIRINDRDGRPRRRAGLLAPVGAGIDSPTSLLLVWMPRFDLVRVTGVPPVIRIDGRDAAIGRLPGRRLHRRHLIKYAAPLVAVELNRTQDAAAHPGGGHQRADLSPEGRLTALTAEQAGHRVLLALTPGFPDVGVLGDGQAEDGRWHVEVDGVRLTGGTWQVARSTAAVDVRMDVDEPWRPGPLPWLMRVVTTVVPVFRRWPTTYRWRCGIHLDETPVMTSGWERIASDTGRSYRRATGS
jgi:hypothetical protein